MFGDIGSFVKVSKQMLKDHLQEGKYDALSVDLISEAKSTPTTNAEAEQDFGGLDRFEKLKSKALDLTIEGMIMFSKNDTKYWFKKLDDKKMRLKMECARKSKISRKKNTFYG